MPKPTSFARFAALFVALGLGLGPARAEIRPLTILHTNDLHARLLPLENGQGGFARLATALERERRASEVCLTLNAGDLVQGSPVSTIFRGVPVYEIANLFAFDAATLGNHEFDYGWQIIPKYLKTARYPVVVSNLVDGAGKRMTDKPYVILKTHGLRVAVIGARGLDPGEKRNLREADVMVQSMEQIDRIGMVAALEKAIHRVSRDVDGIYLSLDMDALDPRHAPGVGTPVPGGLTYREAHLACEVVAETGRLIGMDLVEVNPILDVQNQTAILAVEFIRSALGSRIWGG